MAERRSSSDRRLDRLGTLADINARNSAASTGQSQALMQQLLQMYGLAQQAELDPLKVEAARLANDEQSMKNAWAQPMAEAQYNLLQQKASGQPTMADYLDLYRGVPESVPEYLQPPQVREQAAQARAAKEAEKSAAQQQIDDQEFFSFLEKFDKYDQPTGASTSFTPATVQPDSFRPLSFIEWLGSLVKNNKLPISLTGSR